MSTMESVKAQIRTLIDNANTVTGNTDTDLTTAIGSLIKKANSGGGSSDLVKYVTFMSCDGSTELFKMPVLSGDDCKDPIVHGDIDTPTKESTNTENFTYSGWSLTSGGSADSSALKNVTEDRVVYASFTASVRYYTASFYDGDTLMKEESVAYGSQAAPPDTFKDGYEFVAWTPSDLTITEDTSFYGEWQVDQGWLIAMETPSVIPSPSESNNENVYTYRHMGYASDGSKLIIAIGKQLLMYDTTVTPYRHIATKTFSYKIGCMKINPNGTSLAIVFDGSDINALGDYIHVYTIGTSSFTKVSTGFSTSGTSLLSSRPIAYNSDGTKLLCVLSNQFTVYDTTTWKQLYQSSTYFSYAINDMEYTPDDKFVILALSRSTYYRNVALLDVENSYTQDSDTYFGTGSTSVAYRIAISPDGKYIAYGYSSKIAIYDTSQTPFSIKNVTVSTCGAIYDVQFSNDGTLLMIACENSPYVALLEVGTWTKLDDPSVLPSSKGVACAFKNDDTEISIGLYSNPYLLSYKVKR